MENISNKLITQIKNLPPKPGVYLFKDENNEVLYIGKAKNLKNRVSDYVINKERDLKAHSILSASTHIDHTITKNELAAMLLEAQLIQSYQPKFNVLLKTGQPFLYLLITTEKTPELKIVRNQKQKGTYLGPFIDKTSARKVYDFLIKTFRLKLCKKRIENGCLFYHMGICAGKCRPDFNLNDYLERLELARLALKSDHHKFLGQISTLIDQHNKKMEFEKSKKLYEYKKAFQNIFSMLSIKAGSSASIEYKDIWFLTADNQALFLFKERNSVLTKKEIFYFPISGELPDYLGYFESYYRTNPATTTILVNLKLTKYERELYQQFLSEMQVNQQSISIITPKDGHFANLLRLAKIHAEMELSKQKSAAQTLKSMLKLTHEPHSIDCFDISHKQGKFMVGSCVRFVDGKPDKVNFRHFHIKTITTQDDYAALEEVVSRRYKNKQNLPDLVLIDGGKGQLSAVQHLLPGVEFASLAKKEETIYSKHLPDGKKLNIKTFAGQLLIALRDYTHHFAISFHRKISKLS